MEYVACNSCGASEERVILKAPDWTQCQKDGFRSPANTPLPPPFSRGEADSLS